MDDWGSDPYDDYDAMDRDRIRFENEGSALRASSKSNPRNLPCPSCMGKNRLTPEDKALGYQCDECANAAEMGIDGPWYGDDEDDDEGS